MHWRTFCRVAAAVFAMLSTLIVLAGCALVQVDDQSDAAGFPERILAGFVGGLFAAGLYAPLTGVLSLIASGAITFGWRRRPRG